MKYDIEKLKEIEDRQLKDLAEYKAKEQAMSDEITIEAGSTTIGIRRCDNDYYIDVEYSAYNDTRITTTLSIAQARQLLEYLKATLP
jgi:hypothetical protein